ncbi:MAG: protein-glutamate O-methyltransferase CheR [Flavobacteriales bacterium]|nr:protein-glutamate O-methyltransferase CheR [Flavobacteriales bacterium]
MTKNSTDLQAPLSAITDIEINLLLDAIYRRYGYDFRDYSKAHVKRRILGRMRLSRLESVSLMQHQVLHDIDFANLLLKDLSINVTEMFRDPAFYRAVRETVVPILKTWSYIKLWHAGCSTGEEVYSMAILLKEEGLYDRTQIYATDFNQHVLKHAKEGIYPADLIKKYAKNYQDSGAKGSFSDHYHAKYDSAIMDPSLKKNIIWAHHNLVTDSDFAETHMVVCRNVLIYFNKDLQNRVHGLFHNSLANGGILCLGSKESLRFTDQEVHFEELDKKQKIYKKKYE